MSCKIALDGIPSKAKAKENLTVRKGNQPGTTLSTVDKVVNIQKERAKRLGIGAGNWQPSASYSIRIKTELAV